MGVSESGWEPGGEQHTSAERGREGEGTGEGRVEGG